MGIGRIKPKWNISPSINMYSQNFKGIILCHIYSMFSVFQRHTEFSAYK